MKHLKHIILIVSLLLFVVVERPSVGPFNPGGASGTVLDGTTGLTWAQCSLGQDPAAACSGTATAVNWQAALDYCNTLTTGGLVWRLPNIKELYSIVNFGAEAPAITVAFFPNTPSADNSYYWTSTTHPNDGGDGGGRHVALIIDFDLGGSEGETKTNLHYVRCVAGP
ncbi:DUF1566 domain-containing protein [Leptospira ellisii]|uniref:DUF1566 domain-containing protein n=1 Tax=Leptospira ellisii TaxID=2023197 RepID=A0A2N0B9X6_9LEPT|nr:DUF1566 domain-containing protein [Leptospira ellisii]MDV6234527.1 DUF1566 domain-containing protein [Leptospira ellisii]PJZ93360.1 hypothetical protein CH379_08180 [Leptospira ellisii]PKA04905.1 hypothetical protein CH375_08245 [Leptospira ellisii]